MNTAIRPRVSVVMITRDNAATLSHAIESVIWQTFVNFELWVIGDNCGDHSEDVVNSFCDPRLFWFNSPSSDSNFHLTLEGLKRSRGEYVAYLRDTDLWLPNHLEALVDSISATEADIVFSITQSIHSNGYSELNIPLLPDLPVIPNPTSVLNKKNSVFIPLPEGRDPHDYNAILFEKARDENLKMEVVPITTGLSFLDGNKGCNAVSQSIYIERLRREPDFMNKELSAILIRSQQARQRSGEQSSWVTRLGRQSFRILSFLLNKSGTVKELENFNHHQDVSMISKNAKAVLR